MTDYLLEFDNVLNNQTIPVFVLFSASWCAPCRILSPIFFSKAKALKSIYFIKVDVDDGPDISIKYNITKLPTLCIFKNGSLEETIEGVNSVKLDKAIEKWK